MTYPMPGQQYAAQQATSALAPSVPLAVTSAAFDSGAVVYWNHPGDHDVTSFTVTPYITGTPGATTAVNGGVRQATITGLTNSTAYTFSVHATNSHGDSGESVQSGANTPLANLIFGDDFNGPANGPISPCWLAMYRDGDQSNSEDTYYLPSQVALDGSSHLNLTAVAGPYTDQTYNDSAPPFYRGGGLVTRGVKAGHVQWAYPGVTTTTQGMAVSGFSQPGFNFLYGKIQVNQMQANCGANGIPGTAIYGCSLQGVNAYDPNNVGTANWPHAGSEETDLANPTMGNFAGYNANIYYWTTGVQSGPSAANAVTSMTTTYHTYEVDWSATGTSWWLDGSQVTANFSTYIPTIAMFLDIENKVHTGGASYTQPIQSIDWVRVFHN